MKSGAQSKRIKVLYVIGTLAVGGAEGQLVQLATNLDRGRFEPVVCCLSRGGPLQHVLEENEIKVKVIGLRMRQVPKSIVNLLRFVRFVAQERPAIVHGLLYAGYVLGAFVARIVGVPVVVASRRSLGNYKEGSFLHLALERLANRMTRLIIANSAAVRRDVLRQEHLPEEKVMVIYNGIRPGVVPSALASETRSLLGVAERAPVVGVLANLIAYKGHATFLRAWRKVVDAQPTSVALLVGEGTMRVEIERLVEQFELGASVRLLGSRLDVRNILEAIDLLVHPSFEEGFSNAILEAMAAGKPVVATAVGGNPEAVVDGVTGLLVPPGEPESLAAAVIRMLNDPAALSAFGEAGRRRVLELFDLGDMIKKYERVYMEVLETSSPLVDTLAAKGR
jgi:glycosyltransferase involved in cell wall biosynthesis